MQLISGIVLIDMYVKIFDIPDIILPHSIGCTIIIPGQTPLNVFAHHSSCFVNNPSTSSCNDSLACPSMLHISWRRRSSASLMIRKTIRYGSLLKNLVCGQRTLPRISLSLVTPALHLPKVTISSGLSQSCPASYQASLNLAPSHRSASTQKRRK